MDNIYTLGYGNNQSNDVWSVYKQPSSRQNVCLWVFLSMHTRKSSCMAEISIKLLQEEDYGQELVLCAFSTTPKLSKFKPKACIVWVPCKIQALKQMLLSSRHIYICVNLVILHILSITPCFSLLGHHFGTFSCLLWSS